MTSAIDWNNIGFEYLDTGNHIRADFRNGQWTEPAVVQGSQINMHIAATCLHYGQAAFEGVKVFPQKDGSYAAFRASTHAERMANSARRLCMAPPTPDVFLKSVRKLIAANGAFLPPYGPGATFYVRPLLIGTSPVIGVRASAEYAFIVLGLPVGPYYKDGLVPVKGLVQEKYDRAAPNGVGNVKAAGNYAAGMFGDYEAAAQGYDVSLYLDAGTHTCVDEFTTSNFIGITKDGRYVTPNSNSVLPSVTNKCLQQLAADMGLKVEQRQVAWTELSNMSEIGACGTAAVITPVFSLTRGDKVLTIGDEHKAGPVLSKLHAELQDIQFGRKPDRHGWLEKLG